MNVPVFIWEVLYKSASQPLAIVQKLRTPNMCITIAMSLYQCMV